MPSARVDCRARNCAHGVAMIAGTSIGVCLSLMSVARILLAHLAKCMQCCRSRICHSDDVNMLMVLKINSGVNPLNSCRELTSGGRYAGHPALRSFRRPLLAHSAKLF
jgi:hypothetical protein